MKVNTEMKLRKTFNEGFKSAQRNGLLQGATAISKVVLDKANDTRKTPEQRLEDIVRFCEVSLKKKN